MVDPYFAAPVDFSGGSAPAFNYGGAGDINTLLDQRRVQLPEAAPIESAPAQLPYPSGELTTGGGNAPYVPPGVLPPGNQPAGIDWDDLLKKSAPLMAQIGAQIWNQGGANPMGGAIGGVIAQAIQGQQMSAAYKKKIGEQISGGGGFQQSPTGKSVVSGDLDLLGLSPTQVSELYGTAMKTREAERKYPLDVMGALGTLYSHVTSGNLSAAQIPRVQAEAEKLAAEARNLPYKEEREAYKTLFEIKEKIANIANISARTATEYGETKPAIEKMKAEQALTTLRGEEATYKKWQRDPERFKEDMAKQLRFSVHDLPGGSGYIVFDKSDGSKTEFKVDATTPSSQVDSLALMLTSSTFIPMLEKDFIAQLPPGTRDAREQWGNFLTSMKNEKDPATQDRLIRGKLSKDNQDKYNAALDLYRSGIRSNVSTRALNTLINDTILSKVPTIPSPVIPVPNVVPGPVRRTTGTTTDIKQSPVDMNATVKGTSNTLGYYFKTYGNDPKLIEQKIKEDQLKGAR